MIAPFVALFSGVGAKILAVAGVLSLGAWLRVGAAAAVLFGAVAYTVYVDQRAAERVARQYETRMTREKQAALDELRKREVEIEAKIEKIEEDYRKRFQELGKFTKELDEELIRTKAAGKSSCVSPKAISLLREKALKINQQIRVR